MRWTGSKVKVKKTQVHCTGLFFGFSADDCFPRPEALYIWFDPKFLWTQISRLSQQYIRKVKPTQEHLVFHSKPYMKAFV